MRATTSTRKPRNRALSALFILGIAISSLPASGGEDVFLSLESKATELDLNGDGKVDAVRSFDGQGRLVRARYDRDFDGAFEETVLFSEGTIVRDRRIGPAGAVHRTEQKLAASGNTISERLYEIRGREARLLMERVPDHERKNVLVKDYRHGRYVTFVEPMAVDTSYISDYLDCLEARSADEKACSLGPESPGFAFLAGSSMTFASQVVPISCENDRSYFTGSGVVVDKASCRGSSSASALGRRFREMVEQADRCFNPRTGMFKHPLLFATAISTYSEALHRGGIRIECVTGNNPESITAIADATSFVTPARIRTYEPFYRLSYPEQRSALWHEFSHLSKSQGPRLQIDNQDSDTHNKGDNKRDRVYACEALCFGTPSREQCDLCLSFPLSGSTPHSECLAFNPIGTLRADYDMKVHEIFRTYRVCLSAAGDPEGALDRIGTLACNQIYMTQRLKLAESFKALAEKDLTYRSQFPKNYESYVADLYWHRDSRWVASVNYFCKVKEELRKDKNTPFSAHTLNDAVEALGEMDTQHRGKETLGPLYDPQEPCGPQPPPVLPPLQPIPLPTDEDPWRSGGE